MKFEWEAFKNEDVKYMHCSVRIPEFAYGLFRYTSVTNGTPIEEFGVPGVEGVTCGREYVVRVHKARLFKWDDIEPLVEARISELFGDAT